MFDVSALLFANRPTVDELDLEWSVSAADLNSSSTTHLDDDLETEFDIGDSVIDSYKDDDDETEAPTSGNDREEHDSSVMRSERRYGKSSSWVAFGSDDASCKPKNHGYDPGEVYRYILNGTSPAEPSEMRFVHTVPAENPTESSTCYEVSYEEHCRGLLSNTRLDPGRTRAQSRDDDGFPIGIEDDGLIKSFMQPPSHRALECLASTCAAPPHQVLPISSTCTATRNEVNSTPRERSQAPVLSHQSGSNTVPTKHLRWWGHGRRWTCLALVLAWVGSVLSVFTRKSSHFVTLGNPVVIASAAYEPIHQLGLFHIELCYNESASNGLSGCQVLTMRSNDVSDNTFDVARLSGSLSMILGPFLSIFLSTSVVWETINLRPIGFALLLAYCFQSFTMLLFDSDVCQESHCSVGPGCYLSIAAALCWLGSCLATAAMEAHKIRATRARQRQLRRRVKRALRKAQRQVQQRHMKLHQGRKDSLDTTKTDSASSSNVSPEDLEIESVIEIPSIETLDFEREKCGRYEV